MTRYRFAGTRLVRDGGTTTVTTGDVIEPTEAELEAFGDLLEPVATADVDETEGDVESDTADEAPDPPFDPTDATVSDIEEALSEHDYSDTELDAVAEAEAADGDPRSTALDAIEDARE